MKRLYFAIALFAVIVTTTVAGIHIHSSYTAKNFYSTVAIVTKIDKNDNTITAMCGDGEFFSFRNTDRNWKCGNLCSLILYNNGTDGQIDDKVVYSKRDGNLGLYRTIAEMVKE